MKPLIITTLVVFFFLGLVHSDALADMVIEFHNIDFRGNITKEVNSVIKLVLDDRTLIESTNLSETASTNFSQKSEMVSLNLEEPKKDSTEENKNLEETKKDSIGFRIMVSCAFSLIAVGALTVAVECIKQLI